MKYEEIMAESILKEWSSAWHAVQDLRQYPDQSECKFREILIKYLKQAIEEGKKRAKA